MISFPAVSNSVDEKCIPSLNALQPGSTQGQKRKIQTFSVFLPLGKRLKTLSAMLDICKKRCHAAGIALLGLTGLVLTSCEEYPGMEGDNTAQLISWSYYEPDTNFTQYKTFYIGDSLGVIEDDEVSITCNARSRLIKDQIVECMQNAGYELVSDKTEADLRLTMMEVTETNISISYDPGYWGGYDPWGWGYYYYPYYSYYSPYYISSAYTTQTYSIQMGDALHQYVNHDGKKVMNVVWNAVIKGLTGYNRSETEIRNAIRECFEQTACAPFQSTEE